MTNEQYERNRQALNRVAERLKQQNPNKSFDDCKERVREAIKKEK